MCGKFLPTLFNFAIEVLKTIIEVLIIASGIIFACSIFVTAYDQQKILQQKFPRYCCNIKFVLKSNVQFNLHAHNGV